MSNNTEIQILENQEPEKLTMNYVLEQLEKIVSQTDHLTEAFGLHQHHTNYKRLVRGQEILRDRP